MKRIFSVLVLCLLASVTMIGQSIVGKWKTIDDETGKKKSIVEIYEKDGKYYGKVKQLFLPAEQDQDPTCSKCSTSDKRYNQKVKGMNIITDMKKSGSTYKGGEIMDPKNGKVYSCKLWLDSDDVLKVRGYVGFFFRTQTWLRVK